MCIVAACQRRRGCWYALGPVRVSGQAVRANVSATLALIRALIRAFIRAFIRSLTSNGPFVFDPVNTGGIGRVCPLIKQAPIGEPHAEESFHAHRFGLSRSAWPASGILHGGGAGSDGSVPGHGSRR